MRALKKLRSWAAGWWKPVVPAKPNITSKLTDEARVELSYLVQHLKSNHVSVRDLHPGEIISETPEIDEHPFLNEDKGA